MDTLEHVVAVPDISGGSNIAIAIHCNILQVATALLVAGPILTLLHSGLDTLASSLAGLLQRSFTGCISSFHTENSLAMRLFTHAIAVGHIILVAQCAHRHTHDVTTVIDEQWCSMGKQNSSELYHRGEFLQNYYTF